MKIPRSRWWLALALAPAMAIFMLLFILLYLGNLISQRRKEKARQGA